MSRVTIQKYGDTPSTLLERITAVTTSIQERAYSLFQNRNGDNGSDVDDWLQAERDLWWVPTAELTENDQEIRVRIPLPGFDASDLQISATPDSLVIEADAAHAHDSTRGNVHLAEFAQKSLFRRLDLPARVDVDMVSASLEDGILQISAPKAQPKQLTAAAAAA